MTFAHVNQPPPTTLPNDSFFSDLIAQGETIINSGIKLAEDIKSTLTAQDYGAIELSQQDASGLSLSLPDEPTALDFDDPLYDAAPDKPNFLITDAAINGMIVELQSQLEAQIANPFVLSATVEDAIVARAVDRETAAMGSSYDNYLANQGAMGWESPSGQDQAAFIFFEKTKKGKVSEVSRDVMIKQSELAQTNLFKSLELLKGLQSDLSNLRLRVFESVSRAVIDRVSMFNSINEVKINRQNALIQTYATTGRLKTDEANFLVQQMQVINASNANITSLAIEKAKAMQAFELGQAQLANEGNKSMASVYGQYAASLFNVMSYSQSWSQSVGWSGSESYSG